MNRAIGWGLLAAGVALSIVLSLLLDGLFLFLLFPFLFGPLVFGRGSGPGNARRIRTCPVCGYASADASVHYCPRDGTYLERPDDKP